MNGLKDIYSRRIQEFSRNLVKVKRSSSFISWFRLLVFITGIFVMVWTYRINVFLFSPLAAAFVLLFILLIKAFNRKGFAIKLHEQLIGINKNELGALQGDYRNFDAGNEFIDREHPYTFDLDVFGTGSLFHSMNRTSTFHGKEKLAGMLRSMLVSKSFIEQTQEAVRELKEKIEWRQQFQAYGNLYNEKKEDLPNVSQWLNDPMVFTRMKTYRYILFASTLATTVGILFTAFNIVPYQLSIISLLMELLILLIPLRKVNRAHRKVSNIISILKNYKHLLLIVEKEPFVTPLLMEWSEKLKKEKITAGENIARLTRIMDALDNRMNPFAGIVLNVFLLWDIRHMVMIEHWKKENKDQVIRWFNILGRFDALSSYGCFAFNHPDFVWPKVMEGDHVIQAKALGHPLLDAALRVDNDFEIKRTGQYVIITGPNMAGKSTFLRTVGANMVLAMSGAPVCADDFRFTIIDVFSSMRISDSLQKRESYFYAELKRLRTIIEKIKGNKPLFIILDEILKGTNSKDKEAGSKAFLRQMIGLGGTGIIATHDLSLCEMEEEYPENVRNESFEADIEGKEIHFDYILRKGITSKMNATFLMEQMGIIKPSEKRV